MRWKITKRSSVDHRRVSTRRGATTIELAIVLMVFLTLVFGMLDLGIAVFRYHVLAEAARQGTRAAIVHGSLAERLGVWGPASITEADVSHPIIAEVIQPLLQGFDQNQVTILVEWPDGGNNPGQEYQHRARVTVSTTYQPIITFIFAQSIPLEATSEMIIAH